MKYNEIVGANIKNIREGLGIKAESIAQDIGVSKATFSLIENGKIEISIDRLNLIAQKMGTPIGVFLPHGNGNIQISKDNSTQINGPNYFKDEDTLHQLKETVDKLITLANKMKM